MGNDLTLYERHAEHWWDTSSRAFRSLHGVNRFRVSLLREWLGDVSGLTVVDLGCGGGLLSEALAQQGARVVGVDLSFGSLVAARRSPSFERDGRLYVRADLTTAPVADRSADLVLLADVLEHVNDVEGSLREAARITRPGRYVYVNTLTRTWLSRLLAVTLAEGLGLVPAGTHDPAHFVRPEELDAVAGAVGLVRERFQAEAPAVLATLRRRAIHLKPAWFVSSAYSALYFRRALA